MPTAPSEVPLAYRPLDAARAIGIGKTQLYALVAAGEIELIRLAARTSVIPASSLFLYLERRRDAQAQKVAP